MPFCAWCQLESESDDTCVWCKRPIPQGRSIYGNVALLREDNEPIADRWTGIIGSFVVALFLGVVIYASVNYGKNHKKIEDADKLVLETPLKGSRNESTVQAATYVPPPAPPSPARSNFPSALPAPTQVRSASQQNQGATVASPANVYLTTDGGVVAHPLFFETAALNPKVSADGTVGFDGEAYLVNVSGETATELNFWIMLGTSRLVLEASHRQVRHGDTVRVRLTGSGMKLTGGDLSEARLYVSGQAGGQLYSDNLAVRPDPAN